MELQIQDLVSSIRKEGIDAANADAEVILADAKAKADNIVAQAKAEAKTIQDAAEKEISILKESAVVSADQAKRDAMLSFKSEVEAAFKKILEAKVKDSLKDEVLGTLIQKALEGEDLSKYAVEVAEVNDAVKAQLAQEIKNGLEIRPTKSVQYGFRLSAKDGSGYFDCSDDEIMEMLMPYFRNLDF